MQTPRGASVDECEGDRLRRCILKKLTVEKECLPPNLDRARWLVANEDIPKHTRHSAVRAGTAYL
jgi:hypothetical protein